MVDIIFREKAWRSNEEPLPAEWADDQIQIIDGVVKMATMVELILQLLQGFPDSLEGGPKPKTDAPQGATLDRGAAAESKILRESLTIRFRARSANASQDGEHSMQRETGECATPIIAAVDREVVQTLGHSMSDVIDVLGCGKPEKHPKANVLGILPSV